MATQFRELTIRFDKTSGIRQREPATAVFGSRVRRAQAVLKGFNIRFSGGDREFKEQEIDLDIVNVNNNSVTVAADFVLRDSSGHYDDPYLGWIQCIVIAETE